MIANQMPRIRMGNVMNFEEYTQALALTYLSGYNTEEIAPRVETAYKRAFGMDSLAMLPNQASAYPGCCFATWNIDEAPRVVIAIPGINGIADILSLSNVIGYSNVGSLSGSVYTPFYDRYYALRSRLYADLLSPALRDHPRLTITFTGHSLGAACAEIFAYWFKEARPAADVRLIKFGSPKVGNYRWQSNANRYVKFASFYNDRDPIHWFPMTPASFSPITDPTTALIFRDFVRDYTIQRYTYRDNAFTSSYPSSWDGAEINAAIWAIRAHTPNNPWFDHHIQAYRLNWMNYAIVRNDALQYRFNFLEHNDENQWQVLFNPGARTYADLQSLVETPPTPRPPISSQVAIVANAPPPPATIAPIIGDEASDIGGGGEWGATTPRPVAVLPRRRIRRNVP